MNDIETIRKVLVSTAEAYGPPEGAYVEGFAALDRIEAERHEMARSFDSLRKDFKRVQAEVERLRKHAENLGTALLENRAEVERLQAHIRSESSRLVQIDASRDRAEAEVERLRRGWDKLCQMHEAGIERLDATRRLLEAALKREATWKAEAERLRAENRSLRAEKELG